MSGGGGRNPKTTATAAVAAAAVLTATQKIQRPTPIIPVPPPPPTQREVEQATGTTDNGGGTTARIKKKRARCQQPSQPARTTFRDCRGDLQYRCIWDKCVVTQPTPAKIAVHEAHHAPTLEELDKWKGGYCPICGYGFAQKAHMSRHLNNYHQREDLRTWIAEEMSRSDQRRKLARSRNPLQADITRRVVAAGAARKKTKDLDEAEIVEQAMVVAGLNPQQEDKGEEMDEDEYDDDGENEEDDGEEDDDGDVGDEEELLATGILPKEDWMFLKMETMEKDIAKILNTVERMSTIDTALVEVQQQQQQQQQQRRPEQETPQRPYIQQQQQQQAPQQLEQQPAPTAFRPYGEFAGYPPYSGYQAPQQPPPHQVQYASASNSGLQSRGGGRSIPTLTPRYPPENVGEERGSPGDLTATERNYLGEGPFHG